MAILSFKCPQTQHLFTSGKTRRFANIQSVAERKGTAEQFHRGACIPISGDPRRCKSSRYRPVSLRFAPCPGRESIDFILCSYFQDSTLVQCCILFGT